MGYVFPSGIPAGVPAGSHWDSHGIPVSFSIGIFILQRVQSIQTEDVSNDIDMCYSQCSKWGEGPGICAFQGPRGGP